MLSRGNAALVAALAVLTCVAVAPSRADLIGTPLPLGSGVVPTLEPGDNLANETFLANDTHNPLTGNSLILGNLVEAVYRNSHGTLDFAYQLHNDLSSTVLASVAVSNYHGFATSVGSLIPPLPANAHGFNASGTEHPTTVSRSGNGTTVTFDISLAPGGSSAVFFVHTNATRFDSSGMGVIAAASSADGTALATGKFEPLPGSATVPEPSSAIGAAFGAAAILAYGWSRRRREQRSQAAA
jgi:hypothetical protein